MALQTPGAFFLGTLVPSEQKYLKNILINALKAGYTKFVEPCCGAFAMSHLAVQAGFKPENIEASDVTMFSSIFGYAIMDKPLDELEIKATGFSEEELRDPAIALYALLYLKTMVTAGSGFYFEMLKDLELRREQHIETIRKQNERAKAILKGFNYRAMDLYDHLDEVMNDPKAIIIANPPTYTAGFEKWYNTGGNMTWKEPEYGIFDPNTGLIELMQERMSDAKALIITYEENQTKMMAGNAIFSRYGVRKGVNVYLTTNREEEAERLGEGKMIVRKDAQEIGPLECSMLPTDYNITKDSKLVFSLIEPKNATYYRGLWTHNFVGGAAQVNIGLFIDGYIAGVFGYQIAIGAMILKDILIMYGISIKHETLRMNRLMTMIAMNNETLMSVLTDFQFSRLTGVMTTQITKYPESKEMRGLMKLYKKEKGKLGFKLIYKCEIVNRKKAETIVEWLNNEEKWRKERAKTKSI
jgi:hypothetical protein